MLFTPLALDPLLSGQGMQIINGLVAERGQAPWQVLLENMNTGEICGGAVINLRYILTAAHCTENFRNAGRRPYKFPKNILGTKY